MYSFLKDQVTAAKEIMSGQSGQLIVQNMGMQAMNRTLFEKEQPKTNNRTAMFPKGFGRHATDPQWVQQTLTLEDEGKQKEVDAAQRKVVKASKKAKKVELEERWKVICVAHEEAVVKWKAQCETLREGGMAAKNLPKKPKRILKASLVEAGRMEVGAMKRVRAMMNDKTISHTFARCHTVSEGVNFVTNGPVFLNRPFIQIHTLVYSANLILH
jgi:hypothetical protein